MNQSSLKETSPLPANKYDLKLHYPDLASALKAQLASRLWLTFLLLAAALILGALLGYVISRYHFVIPVGLFIAIPVFLLVMRRPFDAILIWLLVTPFFVITPDAGSRYVYWLTHRTLIPFAVIFALISGATNKRLRFGLTEVFLLAFVLLNVFSILYYDASPSEELIKVFDRVLVGSTLFLLIRLTQPNEVQLKRLIVAFTIMSIVQGSIGLMMNISATRAMLPEAWIRVSSERTTGSLGRVAEYSSTLTASMLLAAHYGMNTRRRWRRVLCFTALLLGSICLVLSFSRGTWLASAIVGTLTIVFYRRLAPYILIMAVIIVSVLSTNMFADSIVFAQERLNNQQNVDARVVSDYAHFRMIAAKPLLGWGYGNYYRYHSQFLKPIGNTPVVDDHIPSHNTFLSMTVELGLLGLVLFFMPWLILFVQSFSAFKRLPRNGFYSRQLLVVLWLGVVFWLVVTNFMNMRLAFWGMTWIWLPLGLIASVVDGSQELASNLQMAKPGGWH